MLNFPPHDKEEAVPAKTAMMAKRSERDDVEEAGDGGGRRGKKIRPRLDWARI